MGVWTDTSDDTRCGVVISGFRSEGERNLQLSVGDAVLIFKQCQGWYYGCNIRSQHIKGIFPKNHVYIKEVSITKSGSYATVVPKELPIVNEMTGVLREWGKTWKSLYVTHRAPKSEEEKKFQDLRNMINELMEGRKKIMSRKLTVDELKVTQQKYSHIIDMGNAKLGLDLVVRDEEGNTLDPLKTSTITLFRQHEVATKRIEQMLKGISSDSDTVKSSSFNLWVNVKAFVCNVTEMSEVYMSLYDPSTNSFFAESFLAKYGDKGLPRDIEMLNNLKVLFTDLGQKDIARDRIFIVCQVIRYGRMLLSEPEHKKETHNLRRPFGIAACDITDIIKDKSRETEGKPIVVPFQPCGEKENLDSVIRKVVSGKDLNHKDQGLHLVMRKVLGDLEQVKKVSPSLVASPTKIARKLGFPDVIMPDDVRNDLYVTLVHGEFKKGVKSSDKNVEVTLSVCNQHGKVLENVISEGIGGVMVSEYKSVIYYHEDKPKWCETIKVALPIDDFYGSHLKFMFKHRSSNDAKDRSEKPFAVSYIRLMHDNGTVTADGLHNLLVYKVDAKKFDSSPTYLKLPSKQKEIENRAMIGQTSASSKQLQIQTGAFSLNMADSFQIQTLVCSTKLTHNVDLMGLLKWRDNPAQLQQNLMQFMRVDGAEVVKFLTDVLDSLFSIFMENSESDTYDTAVFTALIYVVGLVSDVKYHQFRSVLDLYIRENFSATLAYNKLMVVLRDQIDQLLEDEGKYGELLKTMKSLQYIFKFIIRSRVLFAALNEQRGKQNFEMGLMQVFQVLTSLMSNVSSKLTHIQQALLKHLPSTIPDIIEVFVPQDLSFVLKDLIVKIPKAQLTREKLLFILDLVHSDLFRFPDCRKILLNVIMQQLMTLLQKTEQIDLCFTVLSDVMDFLHTESTYEDTNATMTTMLRTVSQTIVHLMSPRAPALSKSVAVLTAILRQMTEAHYKQYLSSFETSLDLQDFLMEILMGVKNMVLQCVFPQDWCEMILLQNSVFLKALRHFSTTIKEKFVAPFNFQLWDTFFQCAITFVSQEPLELHKFSTAKRNKIINRYGDMRREAGFEIRSMWYSLVHNKIQFIPHLVELILQMTLIPETELRHATIPLFYDMMYCEYTSQAASRSHRRTGFAKFENELISQLDKQIAEHGKGDKQYRELFYSILKKLCVENERMRQEGNTFVEMVKDLLLRLLEYRDVKDGENRESKMSCIVGLLNFYEEINRQELYVVYLHKLCDLHLETDNFTEAAHTKMLYAKSLQWSDEEVAATLLNPRDRDSKIMKTQRELKMDTYYDIIDYLDRGKMWEKGIEFCKELANQYETQTFDYKALSRILQRQAQFYDGIMMTQRPKPEYFRVAYYGLGFPSFLQNKEFIYRGKDYDKLSEFQGRLQNLYPNASVMRTLNPPTEEMKNSQNQYLQINAVNPVLQLKEHLQNKKLNEQILKYYRENEVQRFLFSRKRDEGKGDLTTMWLERTYLTITQPLPGILRWFPVTSTEIVEVSPLENALETMSSTNDKIQNLIDQFETNTNIRVDQLSMVLNGVVDAAVNGGIANYKLFYSDEYLRDHPNHDRLVSKLKDTTSLQLLLLHLGLDIHRKNAPDSLMPFQAHLEQRFTEMKSSIEQDYGIRLTKDTQHSIAKKHNIALKRIMSMKPRKASPGPSPVKAVHPTQRSQSMLTRPVNPTVPQARSDGKTKVFTRTGTQIARSPRSSTVSTISASSVGDGSASPPLPRITVKDSGDDKVVVELNQELTPSRPRRPVSSRPGSGQFSQPGDVQKASSMQSLSSVDSLSTTSLNRMSQDLSDAPPPLPVKHSTSVVSTDSHRLSTDMGRTEKQNGADGASADEPPPLLPEKHSHGVPVLTEKLGSQPLLPDKVTSIQRKKAPAPIQTSGPSSPPPMLPPKNSSAAPPTVPPRSPMPQKPKPAPLPPGVPQSSGDSHPDEGDYNVLGSPKTKEQKSPPSEDSQSEEKKTNGEQKVQVTESQL